MSATVGEALARVRRDLAARGVETAALDARVLTAHILNVSPGALIARENDPISAEDEKALRACTARRARGEPVAHLTGVREFWSLDFAVSPESLVPRPDTEALIEAVLNAVHPDTENIRVLDLGVGTGCLLLTLLSEWPRAWGVGVDVNPQAVQLARRNAKALGLERRAAFYAGDWAAALGGGFDVVVANPPYIPTAEIVNLPRDVRDFEPHGALDGGFDGLAAMRCIFAEFPRIVGRGGVMAVEFGAGQEAAVTALFDTVCGGGDYGLIRDLAGRTRGILAHRHGEWRL